MNNSSLYFAILEMNKRYYSTYSLYYSVSQKSDFQNATEAQKSQPKLSAVGPIFPCSWSCFIILVKNDQKIILRHRLVRLRGVPGTGDRAFALWLQKHSENNFFGTPWIQICICAFFTSIYLQQQLQIQTATHMNTVAAAAVQTQVSSNLVYCVFCVSHFECFAF